MLKLFFLIVGAFVLTTCPTFVESEEQYVVLHVNVHGVDGGILVSAVNVVIGVIREGIKIVKPISPHVYKALNNILDDIVNAVDGITIDTGNALVILVETLIKIVEDAVKGVAGLLEDAAVLADGILHGAVELVLTGLKVFLGALHIFLPAVKLVVRVL